jgi:hypothetical protein
MHAAVDHSSSWYAFCCRLASWWDVGSRLLHGALVTYVVAVSCHVYRPLQLQLLFEACCDAVTTAGAPLTPLGHTKP